MKLHVGDMFNHVVFSRDNRWCVTPTNNIISCASSCRPPRLVMGAGHAKAVREHFPGVDEDLAVLIKDTPEYLVVKATESPVIAFQTKRDWRAPSDLDLIYRATVQLAYFTNQDSDQEFHLAFPGIGRGGLDPLRVWPALQLLPENVHLWTLNPLTETAISSSYEPYRTGASRR